MITTQTHIFGNFFCYLMWTNKTCLVATLLGEYGATTDTKICSGATVWISDKGEVFIIMFEPGLWFGSRMERLLINTNQWSSFFIQIYDDTKYPNREIVLVTKKCLYLFQWIGYLIWLWLLLLQTKIWAHVHTSLFHMNINGNQSKLSITHLSQWNIWLPKGPIDYTDNDKQFQYLLPKK